MENCIFCRIVKGDIPAKKVYEDDCALAFCDINPITPMHVVVIPKTHADSLNDLNALTEEEQLGLLRAVPAAARAAGIAEGGYRVVSNCGKDACQSVGHLHLHVLGGRNLGDKLPVFPED